MTILARAAAAYGIRIVHTTDDAPDDLSVGPAGQACSPRTRLVVAPLSGDALRDDPWWTFHELVHVIVQPPWGNTDTLDEDVLLLPFERALATRLGADREPERWRALRLLQQQTPFSDPWPYDLGNSFDENDRAMIESPMWQAGLAASRWLDLVDQDGNARLGTWPAWEWLGNDFWADFFSLSARKRLGLLATAATL